MSEDSRKDATFYVQRHLRFGWWFLLGFLTLGMLLEAFHAFKVSWYLSVANETRRMMWILAHTHGTLLALVHLAFSATLYIAPESAAGWRRVISLSLTGATILLPGGFLLGGFFHHGGDPGLGVILVPIGAILLIAAVFLIARGQVAAVPTGSVESSVEANSTGKKRHRRSSAESD